MNFYCISVLTGAEEIYRTKIEKKLSAIDSKIRGKIHFLRKQMRLKSGKEYFEAFFPGYVFLETEETREPILREVAKEKEFLRFLPSNKEIEPLNEKDKHIVSTILSFGSTIGILPVTFDEGDKIVIQSGVFKGFSGRVVAVNKRNKRVNIELEFMNSAKIVGLTYEDIRAQK